MGKEDKSVLVMSGGANGHMNGLVNPSSKLPTTGSASSLSAFLDAPPSAGHYGHDEVDGTRRRFNVSSAGGAGERSNFERFACDESGMHAMPIMGNSRNSWLRRCIWLLIILFSFGLLTYFIQDRVQKFMRYETTTNVVLKYEANLSFPAVTFCNFNPFYQSLVNDTKDQAILSLIRSNLVDSSIRQLSQATARTIPQRNVFTGGALPNTRGGTNAGGVNNIVNNLNTAGNGVVPNRGKRQAGTTPRPNATNTPTAKAMPPSTTGRVRRTATLPNITQNTQSATNAKPTMSTATPTVKTTAPSTTRRVRRTTTSSSRKVPTAATTRPATPRVTAAISNPAGVGQTGGSAQSQTNRNRPGTTVNRATTRPNNQDNVVPTVPSGRGNTGNGGIADTQTQAMAELVAILTNETALYDLLEPVSVDDYIRENGIQLERMLVKCAYRGVECNASDFKHVFTTFGNCYTFNAEEDLKVAQAGQGHGLEVTLDIESSEYIHGVDQSVGTRVLLHSKGESPHTTVDSLGFAAAPGQTTTVGISSKLVTNLDKPYNVKGCRGNELSDQLKYFKNYTLSNCLLECFADLSETICGCRAPYMPSAENSTACNPIQMFRCIDDIQAAITQGTNATFDCITNDDCVQPCEYRTYSHVLSSALYPSENSVKTPGLTFTQERALLEFRRSNYVHLSLYYEELNYERVEQVAAYDWLSLVSELGGLAGILLGASFLTILEFGDFLMRQFFSAATHCSGSSRQRYNARRTSSFQGTVELATNWTMENKDT